MSSTDDELLSFVHKALEGGSSRDEISAVLASAGWPADEIAKALAAYAEIDFPIPVPRPRPYVSAREAFIYLVVFVTLGVSAFHFGSLLFELIERAYPDVADGVPDEVSLVAIRQAIAALIVAFPIYLLLSWRLSTSIKRDPTKRSSKIRKWLTYMTLFIAASVLVGDFTTVVYNLLSGEVTIRFLLKALTVLVIAGLIFGYYLWDLRDDQDRV
ncbi:MAG: DUF5671 domain-containing protein [Polyangiales bacterium]